MTQTLHIIILTDGNDVTSKHVTDIRYSLIDGPNCLSKKFRKSQDMKLCLHFRKWPYRKYESPYKQGLTSFPSNTSGTRHFLVNSDQ